MGESVALKLIEWNRIYICMWNLPIYMPFNTRCNVMECNVCGITNSRACIHVSTRVLPVSIIWRPLVSLRDPKSTFTPRIE